MPIQHGIEGIPVLDNNAAKDLAAKGLNYEQLTQNGVSHNKSVINTSDYENYLESVNYKENYPSYLESFTKAYEAIGKDPSNVNRKLFEQFLAEKLTNPSKDSTVADIAAASCPFSLILKEKFSVNVVYHQDLTSRNVNSYPYLDNNKVKYIKGNATSLPFSEDSIDYMYLLNSWEHFQAPSDLDFLIEAQRCLKPGGKVVILPLNGAAKAFVKTDPNVWHNKQVYKRGTLPAFRPEVPIQVAKCNQVYAQFHDANLLLGFANRTPRLSFEVTSISIEPRQEWFPETHWDVLTATKKS
jgi:ubiquinone/menaquinone biosynthesis C-methylase UbiE